MGQELEVGWAERGRSCSPCSPETIGLQVPGAAFSTGRCVCVCVCVRARVSVHVSVRVSVCRYE